MKIEPKMSGWAITEIDNIKPIDEILTYEEFVKLPWDVKNGITTHYRCGYSKEIFTFLNLDDVYKIAIYVNYPEELAQLKAQFGDEWWKYYLRFNH